MRAPQSVRKTCNHRTSPAARGSSSTFTLHSNYFASCSQSWLNRSDSSTQPPPAARRAASTPAVPGRSAAHALNAAFRRLGLTADVLELRPKIAWRSMPPLPGELLLTVLMLPVLERRLGAATLAQTEVVSLPGLSSSQTKCWEKQGFFPEQGKAMWLEKRGIIPASRLHSAWALVFPCFVCSKCQADSTLASVLIPRCSRSLL